MNKQRRKDIDVIIQNLKNAQSFLDDALSDANNIRDEEQEYYDNMPENMQNGEKGEIAQVAVDNLYEVVSALEDLDIDDLISKLEEAQS